MPSTARTRPREVANSTRRSCTSSSRSLATRADAAGAEVPSIGVPTPSRGFGFSLRLPHAVARPPYRRVMAHAVPLALRSRRPCRAPPNRLKPLDLAVALAIMVVWGLNFPLAKQALDEFPPIFAMSLRFALIAA